ncbi:hypothetical protein JIN85_13050 [Luteolibacter pohnpeiensis]|uniref:Peptidase M60 domain-containing protein n=1 Tax=Luteolibacter pohnpeiensis TaxID=454153 RepID=A0A934S7N7_9BACT|nr:M60 family metallopeptidase [Luteolibacter pohnpeiensis]MBK1883348.1 hypothetical protein [Luteolibacter pohnpeiensis]
MTERLSPVRSKSQVFSPFTPPPQRSCRCRTWLQTGLAAAVFATLYAAPATVFSQPAAPVEQKSAKLSEVAPEIVRSLEMVDQDISTSPNKAEPDVRAFLHGLFALNEGHTAGGTLAQDHPDLMLQLLADLWQRIENGPGDKLPKTTGIRIRNNTREFDLTDTYIQLLTPTIANGPANDQAIAGLAKNPEVTKLLAHFSEGNDGSTVENALTLGRMIFNIRKGEPPLQAAPAAHPALTIEDLPKLDRRVDLGGFGTVQELVAWAHGMNPDRKNPFKVATKEENQTITRRANAYIKLPVEALLPHPSAKVLMGDIPADAERVEDREVQINLNQPRWQATGLYAAPGEAITIHVPSRLRKMGLQVRIGTQTDNVSQPGSNTAGSLQRFPVVANHFALNQPEVTVGNPFGGGIYIEVPTGANQGDLRVTTFGYIIRTFEKLPSPDLQSLTISGGIEMPWWRPGMSQADWKKELAKPAPWTEMDFGTLCLYVPTSDARKARNPQGLTEFWQKVMDAEWKFGGYTGTRLEPMRISFDRQIAYGFMHSGYPIMAFLPQAKEALDLKTLEEKGNWGFFHEIGHDHQPQCITPDGFTESTVNLFTMSAYAAIFPKRDPKLGHESLAHPDELLKRRRDGESADPWVNISVFLPLIDAFGMDSLTRMFSSYWKEDTKHGDAPRYSSDERQDHLVLRYGQTVKRDVSAYFESVHFYVSPSTKKQLSDFEAWEP